MVIACEYYNNEKAQYKYCTKTLPTADRLIFGVLTPFSTIFQLYHGDQY